MLDKENISRTQEKFSRPAAMPAHPGAAHAARRPKPQRSCTRTGRRKRLPSLPSPPPPGGAAPPLARKTERQSGSVMKCHEMSRSAPSRPSPPALPTLREETPGHVMRCHEMSCSRRAHAPLRPFRPCFGRSSSRRLQTVSRALARNPLLPTRTPLHLLLPEASIRITFRFIAANIHSLFSPKLQRKREPDTVDCQRVQI